ncbi:MAG: hypothetical protein JF888_06040 [Candidatus Dormibacteraeota bacterium]|uniref:Uncharacterized protein n=1 Tax=Candidatus Dormiibacter inghamiae TaxID=3127013 RepID=A0A934KDE6_9BACT|nr:hypothetical protein [Candidatus Dormibacteraeota bacterium]MBJ7606093.1 hypothetical protein [Candidatus Dormibacteraeota bacterium]
MIGRYLLAWLGVLGVAFDLMGGLYLAYDLLGGPRGPLRTIMRAATYAVVFGAFYAAGLFAPFGPIAGAGLGILLGIEFGLRRGEAVSLLFAVARGAVFGVAGWALNGARFGLLLGVCTAVGLLIAYRLRFSVARGRVGVRAGGPPTALLEAWCCPPLRPRPRRRSPAGVRTGWRIPGSRWPRCRRSGRRVL